MSDRDTIQPPSDDHPTERDHQIPSAPPEFDPATSDAPQWGKDILAELRGLRSEVAEGRREHSETVRDWAAALEQINETQERMLRELQQLASRVDAGERRYDSLERRVTVLEERVERLEARRADGAEV